MNTHAFKAFIVTFLLSLNSTCEAGDQCSQQSDCSRNEIRRCDDLPYRQDTLYWLHGHSARVTRSVLDGRRSDSPVRLLRVSDGGQDANQDRGSGKAKGALPVDVENTDTDSKSAHKNLSESLDGAITHTGPK
jgi:hypothetical protein